jgi:magnesium transporter
LEVGAEAFLFLPPTAREEGEMSTRYESAPVSEKIRTLLAGERGEDLAQLIAELHPADRAELYYDLDEAEREAFVSALDPAQLADLFESLDQDDRVDAAKRMQRSPLARVLDEMTDDDAADILQTFSPEDTQLILARMKTAATVAPLLAYASDSAGGLMTPGYIALRPSMTSAEAIAYLRVVHPIAEQAYYLYVVSGDKKLLGIVNLRELIVADPTTKVTDLMTKEVISVPPGTDQEEAAHVLQRYRLLALPVVDEEGVLQGIITADDVIDVISEEATEDMYKMAGVDVKEWVFSPLRQSIIRRVPWLSFNMIWAFAGAAVIYAFQGTLEEVATVAIFMPMIAGQAGNSGIQTATIVVRSLALGEVTVADVVRVLWKEWALGATKGVIFGTVLGVIAWLWTGNEVLGAIAGVSLFANMLIAATAGVLVPMTMRRLGFDPATIAGVFDTMLTDLMGFVIYLGLATLLITQID